jgi:GNAT superfamily N-acetyltransferase
VKLQFRIIGLGDLAQAQELLATGYNEAASTARQYPLSINWAQYQKFVDAGLLHICGCFNGNTLVGFVAIIKLLELWGLNDFVADVAAVYLLPDYRKGTNGYRLLRYAEKVAIAVDCKEIKFSVSRRSKSSKGKPRANLFANLGYQFREAVFVKRL